MRLSIPESIRSTGTARVMAAGPRLRGSMCFGRAYETRRSTRSWCVCVSRLYARASTGFAMTLLAVCLTAAFNAAEAGWRTFGTADGLIHEPVLSMAEDSSGALWFGTDRGVSRSTGAEWLSSDSTTATAIRGILALGDEIWCATPQGILILDRATIRMRSLVTTASTRGGLIADAVNALLLDSRGFVWVGTLGGLSRLDRSSDTWTSFHPGTQIRSLALDPEGGGWAGTNVGAFRYHPDSLPQWKVFSRGGAQDDVNSIFVTRAGRVWTGWPSPGTFGGVSVLDGTTWTDHRWPETPALR